MSLYGGRTGKQLTLTDALTTGYQVLLKPAFVGPILILGIVVNAIVITLFVPVIMGFAVKGAVESVAVIGTIFVSLIGALVAAIVGGLVLNLYGQVWAVMASTGEPPTWEAALARVGNRWISVLGAGLITGLINLGGLILISVVAVALGGIGVLVFIAGCVVLLYVGIRLSMSGWIAAEGSAAMDSVRMSWEVTRNDILVIVGWSIVIGIIVGLISSVLGAILGFVPLVGPAITQTIGVAYGFGASVTLYRRVKDG